MSVARKYSLYIRVLGLRAYIVTARAVHAMATAAFSFRVRMDNLALSVLLGKISATLTMQFVAPGVRLAVPISTEPARSLSTM